MERSCCRLTRCGSLLRDGGDSHRDRGDCLCLLSGWRPDSLACSPTKHLRHLGDRVDGTFDEVAKKQASRSCSGCLVGDFWNRASLG